MGYEEHSGNWVSGIVLDLRLGQFTLCLVLDETMKGPDMTENCWLGCKEST